MYYLYRHIRLDKNEPFYIGVGKRYAKNQQPYKRAFLKTGRNNEWGKVISETNYEVEILYETDSEDDIFKKEIEFIKIHGRVDLGNGTLVNLTAGGQGLFNPSESTRKKVSTAMMGNKKGLGKHMAESLKKEVSKRFKGNKSWIGRKHKEASKKLISSNSIGKKKSEQHKANLIGTRPHAKKVLCENNGIVYNSICDCVRQLYGWNRAYKNSVSKVCNGKLKNYKGMNFKFV